ncbi:lipoate--protein ligase family protein [Candidatus Saganbacteria bacterium]|nr:lipoate--protein ligase family protein [Candidatus Saganbacteria bacterium]
MQNWMLLNEKANGLKNMKRDIELFNNTEATSGSSILRIYSWSKPCISLGYSQKIDEEIDEKKAKEIEWDVVMRPTGGGIVFHNEAEVTYSIVTSIDNPILPKGLVPSYMKISEAVVIALAKIGIQSQILSAKSEILNKKSTTPSHSPPYQGGDVPKGQRGSLCFSYPAEYEIVVDGKKIVGSAQKRGKKALLQQGSIFMSPIDEKIFSVLKKPYHGHNAVSVEEVLGRKVVFDEMAEPLESGFQKILGIQYG